MLLLTFCPFVLEVLRDHSFSVSLCPTCQVRVVRFYQSSSPSSSFRLLLATSTARHYRTSTASARSQWAVSDLNCKCQIAVGNHKNAVGSVGPQQQVPDCSWHYQTLNSKCEIAVGTARPQQQVPDRSGHYRTSTANARSQCPVVGPFCA